MTKFGKNRHKVLQGLERIPWPCCQSLWCGCIDNESTWMHDYMNFWSKSCNGWNNGPKWPNLANLGSLWAQSVAGARALTIALLPIVLIQVDGHCINLDAQLFQFLLKMYNGQTNGPKMTKFGKNLKIFINLKFILGDNIEHIVD